MASSAYDGSDNGLGQSRLLQLPAELRLLIIGYAVQNDVLTMSATEAPGFGSKAEAIDSLGSRWVPLLSYGYNPELMHGTLLRQQSSKDGPVGSAGLRQSHPTTLDAVRATCQSLRADVKGYTEAQSVMSNDWTQGAPLDLYLTFPHGVCAVMERFPNILTRVRNIRIASVFDIDSFGVRSYGKAKASVRQGEHFRNQAKLQGHHLSRLVTFLMGRSAAMAHKLQRASGPSLDMTCEGMSDALKRLADIRKRPRRILQRSSEPPRCMIAEYMQSEAGLPKLARPLPFEHFQFRILYPNRGGHEDLYAEIWSSETPSSLVLRHMFGGLIWLSTARGTHGTSIEIEAVPNAGGGRVLASLWPKKYLEDPDKVLAAEWMGQEWEDKEWKSVV